MGSHVDGNIVTFSHVKWERMDGMWSKVEYRRTYDMSTDEHSDWDMALVFQRKLSDKEYFKAKLNGNL